MISSQNLKTIHATGTSLPKLQRILKADGADTKKSTKSTNIPSRATPSPDRMDGSWLQAGNEFLHSHDGTIPKPAQNIALMAGKRYIVVPKNNAMAVQPAVTVRPDKIGDKAPILPEALHSDISAEDFTSRISPKNPSETTALTESANGNSKEGPEMISPMGAVTDSDEPMDARSSIDTLETRDVVENSNLAVDKNKDNQLADGGINAEATIAESRIIPDETEIKIMEVATNSGAVQPENIELNSDSLLSEVVATNTVFIHPEIK